MGRGQEGLHGIGFVDKGVSADQSALDLDELRRAVYAKEISEQDAWKLIAERGVISAELIY